MPQLVPDDYFQTGVFANARPGELLGSYTCVECAVRSVTWEAFRAHRTECTGRPWAAAPHFGSRLLQQLSALAPGASVERDPFLDASPAALQELERWRSEQEERAEPEQEGHPVPPRPVAA